MRLGQIERLARHRGLGDVLLAAARALADQTLLVRQVGDGLGILGGIDVDQPDFGQ